MKKNQERPHAAKNTPEVPLSAHVVFSIFLSVFPYCFFITYSQHPEKLYLYTPNYILR